MTVFTKEQEIKAIILAVVAIFFLFLSGVIALSGSGAWVGTLILSGAFSIPFFRILNDQE